MHDVRCPISKKLSPTSLANQSITLSACQAKCEEWETKSPRCEAVSFKPDTDLTPRDADGNPVSPAARRRTLQDAQALGDAEPLNPDSPEPEPEPIITFPTTDTTGDCQYFSQCPPIDEAGNSSIASEVAVGTYSYGWCDNDDPATDIIDIQRQKNEPGAEGWWEHKLPLCVIKLCPTGQFYSWDIATSSDTCVDSIGDVASAFTLGDLLPQASEAANEDKELPIWFIIFALGCGIILLIFCTTAVYSSFNCGHKDRVYRRTREFESMSQLSQRAAEIPIEMQQAGGPSPHSSTQQALDAAKRAETTSPSARSVEMP